MSAKMQKVSWAESISCARSSEKELGDVVAVMGGGNKQLLPYSPLLGKKVYNIYRQTKDRNCPGSNLR